MGESRDELIDVPYRPWIAELAAGPEEDGEEMTTPQIIAALRNIADAYERAGVDLLQRADETPPTS